MSDKTDGESQPLNWRLTCDAETFNGLRQDEQFHVILSLARACNTLRFCQQVIAELPSEDSPATARQRINAFLFMAAALYEGIRVAKALGKYFSAEPACRDGLGKVLGEKGTKQLWDKTLSKVRNKVAFHFDADVAPTALASINLPTYSFAAGADRRAGYVYYDLADAVAMNYIIDQLADGRPEDEVTRSLLQDTVSVATRFVTAADRLFAAVLPKMGWHVQHIGREPDE